MSNSGKWFFFFLIVLSNGVFLVSWAWYFFAEIRAKCRAKVPKLYICLCLCCRKRLLDEEIRQEKAAKYRETIISEVDDIRASKWLLIAEFLLAREKMIKAQKFEDYAKFERLVQITALSLNKLSF